MIASGNIAAIKVGPCNVREKRETFSAYLSRNLKAPPSCLPVLHANASALSFKSLSAVHQEDRVLPVRGGSIPPLLSQFTSLQNGEQSMFPQAIPPLISRRTAQHNRLLVPRASKSFSYPRMESKPAWWWRSLACVPYLLPINDVLTYAESVFHLQSFLEDIGFFTYPLLDTMALLPSWVLMASFYLVYMNVVRRKECPHFLRFHIVMAMLLGSAVQIIGTASNWLPNFVYRGQIPGRFWTTIAFVQLLAVVNCMICALRGMYADVPFVRDAAYIHSDVS